MQKNKKKLSKYIIEASLPGRRRKIFSANYLNVIEYELDPRYSSLEDWLKKNNFSEKEQQFLEILISEGIVLKKDENEFKLVLERIKKLKESSVMVIVLSVTYKCNFKCVYCFEKSHYLLKKHMPMGILKKACDWSKNYVERNDIPIYNGFLISVEGGIYKCYGSGGVEAVHVSIWLHNFIMENMVINFVKKN